MPFTNIFEKYYEKAVLSRFQFNCTPAKLINLGESNSPVTI